MTLEPVTLVSNLVVGLIVGLIAVRFAPAACQRFHQFSVSKRSLPLHLLSLVLFAACGALGVRQHNYLMATSGTGMAIVAILALLVVLWNKSTTLADDGSNAHN